MALSDTFFLVSDIYPSSKKDIDQKNCCISNLSATQQIKWVTIPIHTLTLFAYLLFSSFILFYIFRYPHFIVALRYSLFFLGAVLPVAFESEQELNDDLDKSVPL